MARLSFQVTVIGLLALVAQAVEPTSFLPESEDAILSTPQTFIVEYDVSHVLEDSARPLARELVTNQHTLLVAHF